VTRPDPHAAFEELAAGYALHALEPEDEQAFLAHMAACARCERDVAQHEGVLAQLAYAPDAAEPPPSVLEGIRAGIAASGRPGSLPEPAGVDEDPAATPLEVARQRRDVRRLRRAGVWTGIAAAFALVVSLGVWNTSLRQDRDVQDAWGERMTSAVDALRDPDTEVVPLEGESGEVVAVALLRGQEMSLVVDGLPVNGEGTTYVLWGESRFGDKRAVGAFDVTDSGQQVLEGMRMKASIDGVTKLMVTRERGDGPPPIPTLPVLASGTV
jgi:anti-sigma-K factor RskA